MKLGTFSQLLTLSSIMISHDNSCNNTGTNLLYYRKDHTKFNYQ